jgi:hypothetical protein
MRHVDRITVKGSQQPLDIYTCDMDQSKILPKPVEEKKRKVLTVE